MKLYLLLSLLCTLTFASNTFSQGKYLSLNVENTSIREILRTIEDQSSYTFFYNDELTDINRIVDVSASDSDISDLLNQLFKGTDISYKILESDLIVIAPSRKLQQTTITGTIADLNTREPLIGVNIVIEGSSTGTISDINGKYSIEIPDNDVVLVFSYVGYLTEKVSVAGRSLIDITLSPDIQQLDEVVVVGYGKLKKATLTSAVSTVKSDEIIKNTVADVSNTLAGKAPGVISRNWNAEPGEDATSIYVRGISTTGDNNPLIVVDGVPDRDISLVDINDIESVTILKDASAVAPYGSRGGNGVILITTKRGQQGKPTITYNGYYGIEKPTRLPKYASSADYARMFNEASRNEGAPVRFSEAEIAKYEAANTPEYPNTQWWDEIIEQSPVQFSQNLAVSGGSKDVQYYLSIGSFRQDGFFSITDFNRYNFRANIDANITKDIKVSFNVLGYTAKKKRPVGEEGYETAGFLEAPVRIPSIYPVRNAAGQYVTSGLSGNPVAGLKGEDQSYSNSKYKDFNGTMVVEYTPSYIPGLSLKASGIYDYGNELKTIWYVPMSLWRIVDRANAVYQEDIPGEGPAFYQKAPFSNNKQFEFQANYSKIIAQDHQLTALFVFNRTEWDGNYMEGSRMNYASSAIDQLFAGPTEGQSVNGNSWEGSRMGYVGRLTYNYLQKYLFEGNFRYDGSMKFAKGRRWGFFPSFALGWRISEEPFFKNSVSFIDNLKLRGSWGQAGNDRVGDYQYLATYGFTGNYSFGGTYVQTAKESRLANPDITWETSTLTDIGIDATLWKGLLTLEADYFFKRTEDILRPTQKASSIIGIGLPDENIGIVENKGFEFLIGHRNTISQVEYNANFTFTYATNKAVEIAEAEGILNDPIRRRTGRRLNAYYGYLSDGLFTGYHEIATHAYQGTGLRPGDVKYKDINGPDGVPDGIIDGYDETLIGYSYIPEIIFGLNLGAEWKGLDLTLGFQGATNVNFMFSSYAANAFDNGGNIQQWQIDERWTEDNNNPDARYPRLTTSPASNNTRPSDYWLRDGTYIRLKNVQVGYTFRKSLLQKTGLQNLRIYLSGQNLVTWVKDDLMKFDPEANNDRGQFYPQTKVYSLGLNLSF